MKKLIEPTVSEFICWWHNELRYENVVIGQIDKNLSSLIGAMMTTVFLSRYTVEKRKIRHPDIPIEMYMQVVNFLGNAEIVLKRGRVKLVFFFYHNNLYEGVIKSTEDGSELY